MTTNIFKQQLKLSYSDNRPVLTDYTAINKELYSIGVHVSCLKLPREAFSILQSSDKVPLTPKKTADILKIFTLDREDTLNQIALAGRKPSVMRGGSLTTAEVGVPPYPKIYDLKKMSTKDHIDAEIKFGRLHVNIADNGIGVDEVMTLIAGGPWTWFFLSGKNVVLKLSLSRVSSEGQGWRISYSGLRPHGAFMDAEDGICVAYICGPKNWLMQYESQDIEGCDMLGKNPWIDFSNRSPILLDFVR
ncbi:MAG TPA: hypothetical protein QF753_09285 [Victivallales bacterium]|nr:hypothetical protein [Victivallales bacterium]